MLPVPLFVAGVAGALALKGILSAPPDRPEKDNQPDSPLPSTGSGMPAKTGWKMVDKILPALKKASLSSGIPLGLLVGWIAKESAGYLSTPVDSKGNSLHQNVPPNDPDKDAPADTTMGERGYFQLSPDESKSLKLDHPRLSWDSDYSINAGLARIGQIMGDVDRLDIATKGTSYYWKLVKLVHSEGLSVTKKLVDKAQDAGATSSWETLEQFALANKFGKGPRPSKWMPFVDKVYLAGKPFGFGSDETVVGALPYPDIIDPLDVIQPR